MYRPPDVHTQPQTSSGAGLARVGVLSDRQAQSLQALQQQLTKVQLKTRLMGHDVRPTLRKVSTLLLIQCCERLRACWLQP